MWYQKAFLSITRKCYSLLAGLSRILQIARIAKSKQQFNQIEAGDLKERSPSNFNQVRADLQNYCLLWQNQNKTQKICSFGMIFWPVKTKKIFPFAKAKDTSAGQGKSDDFFLHSFCPHNRLWYLCAMPSNFKRLAKLRKRYQSRTISSFLISFSHTCSYRWWISEATCCLNTDKRRPRHRRILFSTIPRWKLLGIGSFSSSPFTQRLWWVVGDVGPVFELHF